MGRFTVQLPDRLFQDFAEQLQNIRGDYEYSVKGAWRYHDRETRLGQLAMIESIIDTFDTADDGFNAKLKEESLDQKAVIVGAVLTIQKLIESESSTGRVGSQLYKLLNTATTRLPKSFFIDPTNVVEAEEQFFKFINNKYMKAKMSTFLTNKYNIEQPYVHIESFGTQIEFLNQLAENQNFIFFSKQRKQLISHYADSASKVISHFAASLGMGAGFTVGQELGDSIAENRLVKGGTVAGGTYLGYTMLGVPGAVAAGVGTHRFAKRLLQNSFGFLFGGFIGNAFKKVTKGTLYYMLYTQFGAMIVFKDLATGACYYVTDRDKFNEFFKIPPEMAENVAEAKMIDPELLERLGLSESAKAQDVQEFKFDFSQEAQEETEALKQVAASQVPESPFKFDFQDAEPEPAPVTTTSVNPYVLWQPMNTKAVQVQQKQIAEEAVEQVNSKASADARMTAAALGVMLPS